MGDKYPRLSTVSESNLFAYDRKTLVLLIQLSEITYIVLTVFIENCLYND